MDRIRTLLAVLRHSLAVCLSIATAVCWADPPNSLWDSLPDTTLGAARVLGNEQLITRFREETKFGAVLFSSERTETLAEAIRTFLSQYAEDLNDKLDQYEIELTELPAIFAGESGGVRCCVEGFSVLEIATICSWDARFEAQERFEIAL